MKKQFNIYVMLLILPLMFASCLDKEQLTITPNLATVTNLQYKLTGDSVKLTWALPASSGVLGAMVIPNANGKPISLKNNATSYTYGIVEVNKPMMYTVKVSDSNGNTSLGSTVKFKRPGAFPIKNAVVTQVDNNIAFSWAAPDSVISGIVIKYADKTINVNASATSYQIPNAAIGTYRFQLYTTNSANLVSHSTYLSLKVGATMLAYLGDAPDSTTMVTTTDDDQVAGAKWFFKTYPKSRYVSFNMIKSGFDLSRYRVLWWNYDIDNGSSDMPAIATDSKVVTAMTTFHKNGGNLLLSTYAIQYLWSLGRMPDNIHLSFDKGAGGPNPDVWGIGVNIAKKHDQSAHPLFAGIPLTTQGDGRVTFPVIGNGWKENHNCIIIVPGIYNLNNDNEQAYANFTTQNNAVWLGMWDGIGDYFMTGIFELQPKGDFQGSSISIGIGGIELKVNDATNPYQANIDRMYKNAIDYLKTR